jgi:hypothetical protein
MMMKYLAFPFLFLGDFCPSKYCPEVELADYCYMYYFGSYSTITQSQDGAREAEGIVRWPRLVSF